MANFNFNKLILGGRITADLELKYSSSGLPVCTFSIAVNRRSGKAGEGQKADFIRCVAWRSAAELITRYFRKGSSICVVGALQIRKWVDNRGNDHTEPEVIVDEVYFVDKLSEGKVQNGEAVQGEPPDFSTVDEDLPF